jgi:D-amino-acid dehydrogenase
MKVAVVGAGIVGVTTAYELVVLGHEVTVFEQQGSVASEASFANAGVIQAGYLQPWARPGLAAKLLRGMFTADAPLQLRPGSALLHAPWLLSSWRNSRAPTFAANHRALHELARFSCQRLLELTRRLRLDYEQMPGHLVLLRSASDLAAAQPHLALLRELGVPHDVMDAVRCRHFEPALQDSTPLHAAIHFAQDGVGNCRQFAQLLKTQAQNLGATFHLGSTVRKVQGGASPQLVMGDGQTQHFDAIAVCAGAPGHGVLARLGAKLPLLPVHAYSATATLRHLDGHAGLGPRAALRDEAFDVTISCLGQRVRVCGGFEIGAVGKASTAATMRRLYRVLDDWFPGAALTQEAQHWQGARAELPDGLPVLGESGAAGVWLNLGHGGGGWTLACGAARVVAEGISGRAAPVDVTRMRATRWR